MSLLIYSGLLYLLGIAIVLAFKPALMFSEDGNWKEFGIGRSKERYTWMPFWLFAILWAILSYTVVLVIIGNRETNMNDISENYGNNRNKNNFRSKKQNIDLEVDLDESDDPISKKGYYILNKTKNGKSNYVYLGPHAPNLHYED